MYSDEELQKDMQNEPEPINKDFMDGIKCSCCGKPIMELPVPQCVINPYEVLCMVCFRGNHTNSHILEENAHNYRLRRTVKKYYDNMITHSMNADNARNNFFRAKKRKRRTRKFYRIFI